MSIGGVSVAHQDRRAEGSSEQTRILKQGILFPLVRFSPLRSLSSLTSAIAGRGFRLSYASMNATNVSTELGARFDDPALLPGCACAARPA
jgi:hypothetical protein